MAKFNPIINVQEDGLEIPEVGSWSREKYNLLGAYGEIFTTAMRQKWEQLVYIDLFSAAGYARFKKTDKIVMSSALIALSQPCPFDKYILVEKDPVLFAALEARVNRHFSHLMDRIVLLNLDSNLCAQLIFSHVPKFSRNNRVLSFCFVDPFSLNLKFETIRYFGSRLRIDFLILLAFGMDANRNQKVYLDKNSTKIAAYIDDDNWREKYLNSHKDFVSFLSERYDQNMMDLGYKKPPSKHKISSDKKNLSLYHLAYYSKNALGNKFYKISKGYTTGQGELF